MVNLKGFRKMVDAVGGVTLNVRDRIPIGGVGGPVTGYIKPGTRKLDGYQTLWFARSRESRRRLLADGAAEVRDERDAAPAQPAEGAC